MIKKEGKEGIKRRENNKGKKAKKIISFFRILIELETVLKLVQAVPHQ